MLSMPRSRAAWIARGVLACAATLTPEACAVDMMAASSVRLKVGMEWVEKEGEILERRERVG